jgi:hypothetical protein
MNTPTLPIQEITLRDYFAAYALQGKLAAGSVEPKTIAAWAYRYADAMIQERNRDSA